MCGNLGKERPPMTTRRPDVSIVVCTYNRAASLRLTLAALDAQLTPPDLVWELIIVDNNSTDTTRSEIERFAGSARVAVRPLFVAAQGLSHARNAGLARSHGNIVGFTDDDVRPAPDWVASVAHGMNEHAADIIGGRILPAWREPPPAWLEQRSFFHGALAIMTHPAPRQVLDPSGSPSVWGANMAFRRKVFDTVGLFDTRRGLVGTKLYRGEEIDLVERAIAAGYRAVYDPSVVVWHRIGPERMRVGYLSRLYFERAEGDALVHGIPLSRYRSVAARTCSWLAAGLRRRPDTLERWLECCAAFGSVWGACKMHFCKTSTPSDPVYRG
jgi:glucosyl-dolichyl phosphate glucuronosyltransferase